MKGQTRRPRLTFFFSLYDYVTGCILFSFLRRYFVFPLISFLDRVINKIKFNILGLFGLGDF